MSLVRWLSEKTVLTERLLAVLGASKARALRLVKCDQLVLERDRRLVDRLALIEGEEAEKLEVYWELEPDEGSSRDVSCQAAGGGGAGDLA